MTIRTFTLGLICSAAMLLSPSIAFAALDLITFKVSPETPGQNQAVTVSVQSYAIDLNSTSLTWYVDKEVVASGVGTKSVQTMTKGPGETVAVNVVIATLDGARYDKQLLLQPIEIDLLWEADTFVPPFYKGKALPTYKSLVKLNAIPRFNTLASDPSLYSYKWTANQTQGLGQGLGKNGVFVAMKYSGSPVPVSVKVNNPAIPGESGRPAQAGSAMQNITAVDPQILFYEDAPLLGIRFERALLGSVNTSGTTFTLRAVPYFFSNDDTVNTNVVYAWLKDNVKLDPGFDPNTFTLKKEGTSAQTSAIGLSVQNRKRVLQAANTGVTVNFSQE